VPGELLRLHTTLLGDLYYPVEEPEAPEAATAEPVVDATPPPELEPDPQAEARFAALAAVHGDLEQQLEALGELDDGSLGRALAGLRTAVAELASALEH
jgi:hypothetical protein